MLTRRGKIIAIIFGAAIVAVGSLIAVYLLIIAPSFVGRTGPDCAMLKQYVDPAALKTLTERPREDIWIIDVRPASAYRAGHIPTARSFPSPEIESRMAELPREKYLIIYCETGGRVEAVIRKLKRHGYTRYMNWGASYRWPYDWTTGAN
ncbi:MAG TPA: rhodanese-like domain-containing protein [Spirochaetota bacterium]|nr:rhodanese-like domain-containing protein [Spirochaetota bacterium]